MQDGNFDNPWGGNLDTTYYSPSSFGPWTVTQGGVDLIGGLWQAPPTGGGSVDLDGFFAAGGISEAFSLTSGQSYTLSFYLSGNNGWDPHKTVDVSIASFNQDFTYVTGANSYAGMMYEFEKVRFVANGADVLSFTSLDVSDSPFGPVIGAVSVTPNIPEPSTWVMMLAGLTGLGFIGYRRSRRPVAIDL